MRRRDFIGLLGSAAAVWPLRGAGAAGGDVPLVGFVNSSSAQAQMLATASYRRGLEEGGFIEGKNVRIKFTLG